jgi:flavin reductase (DIM6/NTAB) family NADH-FMN oxidoreductase RutF
VDDGPQSEHSDQLDRERFDALVARLDPAMVVVTTVAGGDRAGCLVGFHGQTSIEPRRYGLWISDANATAHVVATATHVAVHALTETDGPLARLFGEETGDEVDKFTRCRHQAGPHGLPLLTDLPHRFVGEITHRLHGAGDHVLVVVAPSLVGPAPATAPLRLSAVSGLDPGHPVD